MARVVVATAHHHILEHLATALKGHGHEVVGVLSAGALPVMANVVARLGCPRFELPLLRGELNIGRGMRNDPAYAERVREDSVARLGILQILSQEMFVEIVPGSPNVPPLADGSEIPQLIEPGLFFESDPASADRFAAALAEIG